MEYFEGAIGPNSRFVFYSWMKKNLGRESKQQGGKGSRTITVYFKMGLGMRRIPLSCLDSLELEVPKDVFKTYMMQVKRWYQGTGEYDMTVTHQLMYPFLEEVLKEHFLEPAQGACPYQGMSFLCCMGSRVSHKNVMLNLVDCSGLTP